ncbi:NAD(P)H-binding protein [Actinoallomurus acanthiterrae]
MAKIAVVGATGNIGGSIVREALNRGHEVTAVVRDPAKLGDRPEALEVAAVTDVFDPKTIAEAVRGHDVVVSALGGAGKDTEVYRRAAETYVEALRGLGDEAPRLIVVGGAGSLEIAPGTRLLDLPDFPEAYRPDATAQGEALAYYRTVPDVKWTYFSPAAEIGPGTRTGGYRTDADRLVTDAAGDSRISYEDYAAALVDEIESPQYIGARFTAAAV